MNCKVIATSFEGRREIRTNSMFPQHNQHIKCTEDILKMLKNVVATEDEFDAGVPMDTILVVSGNSYKEGVDYVLSLDGQKTRNGIIRSFVRENVGGSFGAYSDAFNKYDYDYWLFTEDDILVGGDKYYKKLIRKFEKTKSHRGVGFVALIRCVENHPLGIHADGGVGLSHKSVLGKVNKKWGCLPHHKEEGWDKTAIIREGEVAFTNAIYDIGYEIIVYLDRPRWDLENKLCKPYFG